MRCPRGSLVPRALSPTEIHAAWAAGASAVKLFPAVVPTGGVSAQTAAEWIAAGAVAVCIDGCLIGDGDPSGVTDRAGQVAEAVGRADT